MQSPDVQASWDTWPYRLGCPVWNCKHWEGEVYPDKASSQESLHWYARCFGTVEGNSTFYGLPAREALDRWCTQSSPGFRFAMKVPRAISHDAKLVACEGPLQRFLDVLSVLHEHDRLGPTFLQLGPDFSSKYANPLESFLERWPKTYPLAVEFRHRDWFDEATWEERIGRCLQELQIDRVIFDSRPLNSRESKDATEEQAQRRKPQSPWRATVTHSRPFVRLIGLNDVHEVESYWVEWADQVVRWIQEGLQPWIFTHAPDDRYAPRLARRFHELVREKLPQVPELPRPFPPAPSQPQQLSLFD